MRFKLFLISAALLASACTTTAPGGATAAASHDCFRNQDIQGWSVIDDRTLKVTVGASREYALATQPSVSELNFQFAVAIRSRGSDWICVGRHNDVHIDIRDPIPRTWWVTEVTRLPPRSQQPAQPAQPPQGS